ncbi:Transmembrane protein [Hirschfeldia incana]|nr:Transmembrane protein [Hirschfeldia incana]
MHALTNSGAVLLAVLLLFLLIFFAELSYIFCRLSPSPTSKEVLLQLFMCCKKNQSRIEPTGTVSVQIEEDTVVAVATEEEEDVMAVDKWEPTPFLTPCGSPPYFTPSPSPCRDVDDDVIDVCL